MHTGRPKARVALMLWCLAVSAGAVAACGSTGSGENRLVVNTFGDFGYRELYTRYEQSHPGLKIVERVVSYDDHHKNLQAHLLAGSGTGDVEAVDGGYIALFKAWSDKFVDFKAYGADPNQWLAWKSQQATASGGKLMGLGTDIGGLAMCYRSDLFAKAGLPSNRDAVAALWPDWRSYIETGKRFKATAPNDVAWFDSGANLFNAIIGQASVAYVDSTNKVVVGSNPAVKQAYDLAVEAVQAGESAKLSTFSQQWNAGFQRGSFATVTCPAWMTDTIKLNAPEQASWIFRTQGHLPSQATLYDDPAVVGHTNPFFNNAPTGQIFAASAKKLQPQRQGPKDGDIGPLIGQGINRVETGKQGPERSWRRVLKDVAK